MAKRPIKHRLTCAAEAAAERRAVTVLIHSGKLTPEEEQEQIGEINELAAAVLDVLATQVIKVVRPQPGRYIGAGAAATLAQVVARCKARRLVFSCELSVTQVRNLEEELKVTVIDRTDLILEIFSQRAQSHEGKLQVELAHCRRQMARLAGRWTHLERQRGGIGLRGGPGEKQMELDRRLLAQKIRRLEGQIAKMTQRKQLARQRRRKNGVLTAALVGYTNAGKTSLFNLLAQESATSDDRPFVTLDSTARRVRTVEGAPYILSDTVGFIRDLPHELVAGFRATLADTAASDLLLIVADAARADWQARLHLVETLLAEINASSQRIVVFNKIDLSGQAAQVKPSACGRMQFVYLSCRTGEGVSLLQQVIAAAALSPAR